MDAKITKLRLSRMLSYDWIKIVGTAVAVIFAWVLIFTMTATRILPSQEFVVGNYIGNLSLRSEFDSSYNKVMSNKVLSGEVLTLRTEDLTISSDYAYQVLQARVATGELDVMFISQQGDPTSGTISDSTEENVAAQYKRTYLENFVNNYIYALHDVEKLLDDMQTFVNRYYDEEGKMNEQKVEEDFRARALRMKDKRYKKEAQILEGIKIEKDRIEKYRTALLSLREYIEKGYVTLTHTEIKDDEGKTLLSGKYSFNICPTTVADEGVKAKLDKLSNMVGYEKTYLDEEGNEKTMISSDNMNVCLFDIDETGEEVYEYEGIVYVHYLVTSLLSA